MKPPLSDLETDTDGEGCDLDLDLDQTPVIDASNSQHYNGIITSRAERRADKTRLYNFSKAKKSRKWLKNILLSDSSDDESDSEITEEYLKDMMRQHKMQKKAQQEFSMDPDLHQYQYY